MAGESVKMTKREGEAVAVATVAPDQVATWEAAGWKVATKAKAGK